jgi:hypothetical protein
MPIMDHALLGSELVDALQFGWAASVQGCGRIPSDCAAVRAQKQTRLAKAAAN